MNNRLTPDPRMAGFVVTKLWRAAVGRIRTVPIRERNGRLLP
jgi:hypothetical protein